MSYNWVSSYCGLASLSRGINALHNFQSVLVQVHQLLQQWLTNFEQLAKALALLVAANSPRPENGSRSYR
jgi:hypothetical protein